MYRHMPKTSKEKSGSNLPKVFCEKSVLKNVLIPDIHGKKPLLESPF